MPEARTAEHEWFQTQNHVRMVRQDITKTEILDSGLARLPNQETFNVVDGVDNVVDGVDNVVYTG